MKKRFPNPHSRLSAIRYRLSANGSRFSIPQPPASIPHSPLKK